MTALVGNSSYQGMRAAQGGHGTVGVVTMTFKAKKRKGGTSCEGAFRSSDGRVQQNVTVKTGDCRVGRKAPATLALAVVAAYLGRDWRRAATRSTPQR